MKPFNEITTIKDAIDWVYWDEIGVVDEFRSEAALKAVFERATKDPVWYPDTVLTRKEIMRAILEDGIEGLQHLITKRTAVLCTEAMIWAGISAFECCQDRKMESEGD